MKKFFLVLFIFCAALFVAYSGVSYWTGMQAQKHYDLMISKIARPNVEITNKSFVRGIFTSTAITAITLKQTGAKPDHFSFTVINSIQHGPLAFAGNAHLKGPLQLVQALIRTHLAPGPENGDALRNILEKIPELQSSELLTVLFLDGSGETYIDVPAFRKTFEDEKGGEFNVAWSGLGSKSNFDVGLGEVTGSLAAPGLEMWDRDSRFRLVDLKSDFNSHPGIKGLVVGSASVSAKEFDLTENQTASLRLLSPGFRMESGASGEAVDASLGLYFDTLEVAGETLGPFELDFEARKLDADALFRMQQFMANVPDKISGKSDQEIGPIFISFFTPFIVELISKSPEFELTRLKIRTSRGDLTGKAKLSFAPSRPDLVANPLALINSIDASAELSVSEALFFFAAENILRSDETGPGGADKTESQDIQTIVDALLSKNLMVRESGAFKSNVAYSFGRLIVNGHRIEGSELSKGLLP